jgi:KaiC/GvpD/RAD55 family RecA-like ATPase
MADPDDDFDAAPPAPSNVIPFPSLRANAKLSEAWATEVKQTRHELLSPLDVVAGLIKVRGIPPMPMPPAWPEMARRARTYPGDCIGIVGAIGGGKTSKAIQWGLAVSGSGYPVLWVPLELGREQLICRIIGNMCGVHAMHVRDEWSEERIRHQLSAVTDMWHFVDRYDDTDVQLAAIRDAIEVARKIYRVTPLVVVDHIGQLITESSDARLAMLRVGRRFEKMALETNSWIMLLAQGSRSNQAMLTGRTEVDSASDAIGAAAESSIMEAVCANVVVTTIFKADDAMELDGHDLISKARHTGLEGKIGVRFSKPGGVWSELDYLPATPGQVKEKVARDKKDKHRVTVQTPDDVRKEINASRADEADADRRVDLLAAVRRAGPAGLLPGEMRQGRGLGRQHVALRLLQELQRAGQIERVGDRWRAIVRL